MKNRIAAHAIVFPEESSSERLLFHGCIFSLVELRKFQGDIRDASAPG
jgi:hypothetical protein